MNRDSEMQSHLSQSFRAKTQMQAFSVLWPMLYPSFDFSGSPSLSYSTREVKHIFSTKFKSRKLRHRHDI